MLTLLSFCGSSCFQISSFTKRLIGALDEYNIPCTNEEYCGQPVPRITMYNTMCTLNEMPPGGWLRWCCEAVRSEGGGGAGATYMYMYM